MIVKLSGLFFWLFQSDYGKASNPLVNFLAIPAETDLILTRPWSIITYMFLHEGFFHILFNMIVLYFSGKIFLDYLRKSRLISVYLLGGISGALAFILAYNTFPVFEVSRSMAIALGASASVLAILAAVTAFVPNYTVFLLFFGKIKLKYLALIFFIIDILSIQGDNPGGHIAHLGGFIYGFLSTYLLKSGYIHPQSLSFNWLINYFRGYRGPRKSYNSDKRRPVSDDDFNTQRRENQARIDAILDKISVSGYSSLSKEEKEFLFKSSKKN